MRIVNERLTIQKNEITIGVNDISELSLMTKKIQSQGMPIRFVVVESNDLEYVCEVDVICEAQFQRDIFTFIKRDFENHDEFNIAFCIPTGIGAELGGHCGDANATVRLFGSICDNLITHPNCVNGANYNEQPANALYVEGSVFTRLFMGTIGLKKAVNNKILLLVDKHKNHYFNDEIVNAVSTARMMLGIKCDVHIMDKVMSVKSEFTSSGRASGIIENIDLLFDEIDRHIRSDTYGAIALSTYLDTPVSYYNEYFIHNNMGVNPWGSAEAMITHAVSERYKIPCAHAPLVSEEAYNSCNFCGVVDPRKAAESESIADIYCCLKGLRNAPKIVPHKDGLNSSNISCLVIPSGCVGLPVLSAFAQGIPVISVKENANLMQNRYSDYIFKHMTVYEVNNYWEALGVCQALKIGIDPHVLRRPILPTNII